MRLWLVWGSLGACVLLSGCATTERMADWPRTGDPLIDGQTAIAHAPARDKPLWEDRTAAVAMRRGQYDLAKSLLDDVLLTIGGISAKDPNARKARSLFHGEARKTFHGEPYERVMAYYYRGILYWMDGQPDNARACFRSGEIEDSDTENRRYAGDYALLDYLDGFATAKLGGDGSDAFNRAQREARLTRFPPYDPRANVLVFAEYGNGPTKFATGEYMEQLRFQPGVSPDHAALLRVDHQVARLDPYDDLNFQAVTRGGRVMDYILGRKAVFKSTTDTAGTVALIGGAGLALTGNREAEEAGLGLIAAGLISKGLSALTTPAADVRAWNNLPEYLSFAAVRLPAGQYTATVEFLASSASTTASFSKTITITVTDPARDTVVFVSDKNQ